MDDMAAWARKLGSGVQPPELEPVDQARIQVVTNRLTTCFERATQVP